MTISLAHQLDNIDQKSVLSKSFKTARDFNAGSNWVNNVRTANENASAYNLNYNKANLTAAAKVERLLEQNRLGEASATLVSALDSAEKVPYEIIQKLALKLLETDELLLLKELQKNVDATLFADLGLTGMASGFEFDFGLFG